MRANRLCAGMCSPGTRNRRRLSRCRRDAPRMGQTATGASAQNHPQGRIAKLHSLPFMSGCCALGRRGRGRSRRACAKRGSPPKRPVSVLAISSMQRTARSGRWPRANSLHRHASGTGGGTAPLCHLYYMNNRSYRTVSVPYVPPGTTPSWAHLLGRGKAAKPRAAEPKLPAKVAALPTKAAITKPSKIAQAVKRAASKLPSFSHFLNPAAHVWTDDEPDNDKANQRTRHRTSIRQSWPQRQRRGRQPTESRLPRIR